MKEFKGTKGTWMISGGQVVSMPSQCKIANNISGWNYEESKANTQLVSASPELLEDLQEAVELFESAYKCMADGDNEGLYNALANATSRARFKETINKALGL
ncbi:hypothetical protein [Dysgonomonas mossii]|uniref:hypothetical protein n=1 Tax=Dysgonomonas mossii TaxID=163665 RepID=UPI003991CC6A